MALILVLAGICFAGPLILLEPYRRDFEDEQKALAAIEAAGGHVGASRIVVPSPRWLRWLVGPSRSRYFERVNRLYFTASDAALARLYQSHFEHLSIILQD